MILGRPSERERERERSIKTTFLLFLLFTREQLENKSNKIDLSFYFYSSQENSLKRRVYSYILGSKEGRELD
jgi:hypothetical protein